ncbi:MAG: DUF3494 domain-containing protein [Akkermansiaceae bacterium]|nr:DUF3494 domain-containing protein [Verrucomicrobiales bacterium]
MLADQNSSKRILQGLVLTAAVIFQHQNAIAVPVSVNLGSASEFAVLAGSGITVTGPTTITGDIGTFPNPSITGFGNATLNGANHGADAVTAQAKIDLGIAYVDAAGRSSDTTYGGGFDLVGLTLPSGVYSSSSSLFLSGTLTLNAQGNPDAVWIFQMGSSLVTASDSLVSLIGGAQACHVFWQVGSSATLGTDTDFVGNILASESITLNTGATVEGRVLAQNGAVTLDQNAITRSDCDDTNSSNVPDKGSTILLLGAGTASLLAFRSFGLSPARRS